MRLDPPDTAIIWMAGGVPSTSLSVQSQKKRGPIDHVEMLNTDASSTSYNVFTKVTLDFVWSHLWKAARIGLIFSSSDGFSLDLTRSISWRCYIRPLKTDVYPMNGKMSPGAELTAVYCRTTVPPACILFCARLVIIADIYVIRGQPETRHSYHFAPRTGRHHWRKSCMLIEVFVSTIHPWFGITGAGRGAGAPSRAPSSRGKSAAARWSQLLGCYSDVYFENLVSSKIVGRFD